ncbi:hypothetical protein [Scytonema sp. PCC 10023]|uniref:hypothetical protein n=1 Tax=Scytonema sp. PCC 10023 TaxID=1680591 RepID=UPI0039C6E666
MATDTSFLQDIPEVSPVRRVTDAVASIPGTGNQSSGGSSSGSSTSGGSNPSSGGFGSGGSQGGGTNFEDASQTQSFQARVETDQLVSSSLAEAGITLPGSGAGNSPADSGSGNSSFGGATDGGNNPFDPGFGSNVSNQAIQASQSGGGFGGGSTGGFGGGSTSGFGGGSTGGFGGGSTGGFGGGSTGGFGGGSTGGFGGGSTGGFGGGSTGGDSNQSGSPFSGNASANEIDATRFGLTDSITSQVSSGNPDSNAIASEIDYAVNNVVNNLGGTSSIDAGNAYTESTPVVGGGSELSLSPNSEVSVDPITNYQGSASAVNEESLRTVSDFLINVSDGSFDPSLLSGVDSESFNTFAGLINEYAQTGSVLGSGSNQSTNYDFSQLQGGDFISSSTIFDTNQFGGSSPFA